MYAKLSSTITRSSIWREPPPTRCVWITLLALANKDGFVKGVEAWLASEANVSRDECREALRTFMEPDPESQDQDFGGRRVDKVEGGWLVLNYAKYREMRTNEQMLAAQRQQRKRSRDKQIDASTVGDGDEVTRRHAASRGVTAIASASASVSERSSRARARRSPAEMPPDVSAPPDAGEPAAGSGDAQTSGGALPRAADPPAAETLEAVFTHEAHREAYRALRRGHRLPIALDAALRDVQAPITGGTGFSWAAIGAGLLELQGNGQAFNVALLRGYCRRWEAHADGRAASATPDGTVTASAFWALCRDAGLLQPMLTAETVHETVQGLAARGAIADAEAFERLVLAVQPWELLDVRFPPERDRQLVERLQRARERAA